MVLGGRGASIEDVIFIRRNSLHGAALAAAGGRNAVDEDVLGVPRLGLERLLRVDPDVLIVLSLQGEDESVLQPWRRLTPMRAVRDGRIAVVPTRALTNGPSVLDLKDRLAAVLTRLPKAQ
jgi:ABC-type Fe3+-hydroxamate transport system substrate-binding protein